MDFCNSAIPLQFFFYRFILLSELLMNNRIQINGEKRTNLSDKPIYIERHFSQNVLACHQFSCVTSKQENPTCVYRQAAGGQKKREVTLIRPGACKMAEGK